MTTNQQMAPNKEFVEVTWSGKKIFLERDKLDEWYHGKSFEDRRDYVETHPYVQQKIALHHFNEIPQAPPDPEDYALVHWSGNKVLMLHKKQLDEWFHSSYEKHVDYVKKHPDCVIEE